MLLRWRASNTSRRLCGVLAHRTGRTWSSFQSANHYSPLHTNQRTTTELDVHRQRRKDVVPTADTIYALSTAPGRAAIAIVRISGPACLDIYGGLCPHRPFPVPRTATLRKLLDPIEADRVIDPGALVLYFPAPRTVTGEDVLELHIHGGPAIVRSVLEAIPKCIDSRPRRRTADYSFIRAADPGEFTKRAFYNGMMDLTQAEALGETLAAETEQQRRLAVAGSSNSLSTRYEQWRQQLLYARGELEALIDFSEDQHFDESPASFVRSISTQVKALAEQIELHVVNASRGELMRSGISVALLGAPNAGKSSLLNLIVGREAAIVSSEPGTTRDIVDVSVDIGGWLVKLGDMAGLRTTADSKSPAKIGLIEQEGIRRARERALQADVIITLVALKRSTDGGVEPDIDLEVSEAVRACQESGKTILYVVNKTDLLAEDDGNSIRNTIQEKLDAALPGGATAPPTSASASAAALPVFFVSCKEAALRNGPRHDEADRDPGGIQDFLRGLIAAFTAMTSAATGHPLHETSVNEAQAYWSASLSVTHRQSAYLAQNLSHLRDFLCMHDNMARGADQSSGFQTRLSHHVDNHADLVGEVVKGIDTHQTERGRGLRQECNISSAVAVPGDHPPLSADHGTGFDHNPLAISAEEQFDIVQAAEHLRYAADCLAKITGRGSGADVEEVLGVVFEK